MEDLSFKSVFRLTQAHVQSVTLHLLLGLLMFLHGSSCNHRLQAMSPGEKGRGRVTTA